MILVIYYKIYVYIYENLQVAESYVYLLGDTQLVLIFSSHSHWHVFKSKC